MSATQAAEDGRVCIDVAQRAKGERSWTYIGCLISKGHTVGVPFSILGWRTYVDVTQTQSRPRELVMTELQECRRIAYATPRSGGVAASEGAKREMERVFTECATSRGYAVEAHPGAATGT
ncbi:MAG: hypothetical protein ACRD2A_07335 [Vicinamibacterales bacterium]